MPNISFRLTTTMLSVRSDPVLDRKYSVPLQSGFTVIDPVAVMSGIKNKPRPLKSNVPLILPFLSILMVPREDMNMAGNDGSATVWPILEAYTQCPAMARVEHGLSASA